MMPVLLPPNQLHHFYAGGAAIAAFRGTAPTDDYAPEDWVGSTTTMFGQPRAGLSVLADGTLLAEAIAAEPEAYLGPEHVAAFGPQPGVLVKLLDTGQRLPVHVHPDRAFAARHLGCRNGKTEAWVVVETSDPDPAVYLGFREVVDARVLAAWVDGQATTALRGALNRVPVRAGDTVLVPAGTPHAIGAGVFIVELQEPTDFSVLLEWEGFDIDGRAAGHLGLGMDLALRCVDRSAWDRDRIGHHRTDRPATSGADVNGGVRPLLPVDADPFFRAERVLPNQVARLDQGFSILVVVDGTGWLETAAGDGMPVRRGQTVLVPHAAGATTVSGAVHAVRCRPPAPDQAPPDPGSDLSDSMTQGV
ncbi:MAG TPA: class I mannose-6-phosphate isomerase [Euzebyales bacterium]|nr:class I mannose-6-phosphate isomerase [Euzebyales bacterium]